MIVAVASGKGGTGKTLVATSLARSLSGTFRVLLLDCDVEGPDAGILIKPEIMREEAACVAVPEIDPGLDRARQSLDELLVGGS